MKVGREQRRESVWLYGRREKERQGERDGGGGGCERSPKCHGQAGVSLTRSKELISSDKAQGAVTVTRRCHTVLSSS